MNKTFPTFLTAALLAIYPLLGQSAVDNQPSKKEVKVTSYRDFRVLRGWTTTVDIEILSIDEEDHEITTEPLLLQLPTSYTHYPTQVDLLVHHTIKHSPPFFDTLLNFSLINIKEIDKSVITFGKGIALPDPDPLFPFAPLPPPNNGPIVIVAHGIGTTILDFSYTKVIEGHYQDWFNWTWIPEQKITTIVHVPVQVVDP